MDRRAIVCLTVATALDMPFRAWTQVPERIARIGYLASGGAAEAPFLQELREGLREAGWIEGRNLVIHVRLAQGDYGRLPDLARSLVQQGVDLIFASSTPSASAAKEVAGEIPIVIGRVADPVGSGLVASLARPGGNITGWSHQGLEMRTKYLDLIKEAVPQAAHIGVLWNPKNPIHAPSLKTLEPTAQAQKITLHPTPVSEPGELLPAFQSFITAQVKALVVFLDGMFLTHGARIVELAASQRLPAIYGSDEMVHAGGLMSYGVNLRNMYRHGAWHIDRILKGAKPGELPVEQPTKFELLINAGTARALGFTLPRSLLLRADKVIG
jgi:putative ABC transport system substrate-binding protein